MTSSKLHQRWVKLCALANDSRTPHHEAALARDKARKIYQRLCRVYSEGMFKDPAQFNISYPTWRRIHVPPN